MKSERGMISPHPPKIYGRVLLATIALVLIGAVLAMILA
jgi:hypothetical protein